MTVSSELSARRQDILQIAAKYGARSVRVFGSMARGEAGPSSDVDFLVELEEDRTLLDLGHLWQELESLLGRKVHMVEPEGIHWYIRDRVLNEAIPL